MELDVSENYLESALEATYTDVEIDDWWKDLLSQDKNYDFCSDYPLPVDNLVDNSEFDILLARDGIPWGESYAAQLIANKFKKYLRFNADQNIWYLWNGIIHVSMRNPMAAEDIMERFLYAYERAYDYVEWTVLTEIERIKATRGSKDGEAEAKKYQGKFDKLFKKHLDFRNRLRPPEGRNRVISDLKRKLSINPSSFKDDTNWFVFRNGVLDCKKVKEDGEFELLEHNPSRNVLRYFDADYVNLDEEPEKNLGHWDGFLESSIPDPEVREYVQACVGAAFTGNKKLRTFLVFEGEPSSGKSLFLETFDALGEAFDEDIPSTGYVLGNIKSDAIIRKRGGTNFSQAQFGSNRLVGLSEPNAREELDGEFLKEYTGDKKVSAEKKFQDAGPTIAQGLLIVATNEMPRMNSMDKAVMNRMKIVKFPNTFVDNPSPSIEHEKQADNNLSEKLIEDRSAILWWVIQGMIIHKTQSNAQGISYNRLDNSEPLIMKSWSEEHTSKLQTPLTWMKHMEDEGTINYISNPMEITQTPKKDMLRVSHAHKVYSAWCADDGAGAPMGVRNFSKLIMDQYSLKEYPNLIYSGYNRFPMLTPTPEFDRLLVEAESFKA